MNAVFEVSRSSAVISVREDDRITSVELQPAEMNKLLKWMVHSLEICCWQEDYVSCASDDWNEDLEEWEEDESADEADDKSELPACWQLDVTYRNDETQLVSSPYPAPDRVQELVQELLAYLHPEEDDEDFFCDDDSKEEAEE